MATRESAIYDFLNSFGIPAYASTATPENAEMPYITYTLVIGDFYTPVTMTVDMWYYTSSEALPNKKVREIEKAIKDRGRLKYQDDEGITRLIIVNKGSPWCQSVPDDDNSVKRRYMNFDLEYLEI